MAFAARAVGAAVVLGAILLASAAVAECSPTPLAATGKPHRDIETATRSAYDALVAKIKATLGAQWTPGSRRGAEYTCVKPMGGQVSRLSWTCSLRSYPCRP
jgi:hypothetical protein